MENQEQQDQTALSYKAHKLQRPPLAHALDLWFSALHLNMKSVGFSPKSFSCTGLGRYSSTWHCKIKQPSALSLLLYFQMLPSKAPGAKGGQKCCQRRPKIIVFRRTTTGKVIFQAKPKAIVLQLYFPPQQLIFNKYSLIRKHQSTPKRKERFSSRHAVASGTK